jgi:acetyl/propionyl-CoA carboxylase alpha subunit
MLKVSGKTVYEFDGSEEKGDLIKLGENQYHLLLDGKSYSVELLKSNVDTKDFVLKVNNRIYKLKAQNEIDLLLKKLGMEKALVAEVSDLKAPMPGLVLSIEVEEGQEVKKGDVLMILEAMKMENAIKAPADLVIKEIKCKQSEAVDKSQVLMIFGS